MSSSPPVDVDAHDEALAVAAGAAAGLGLALARFETALAALRAVTPKCACGWARGHSGPHRVVRSS